MDASRTKQVNVLLANDAITKIPCCFFPSLFLTRNAIQAEVLFFFPAARKRKVMACERIEKVTITPEFV